MVYYIDSSSPPTTPMDIFKRVVAALEGEQSSLASTRTAPKAPLSLEQKRLHVLLVLLKKHAQSFKKQTGMALTLKTVDRIIHLLRENLHYFEKMRMQMVKASYEPKRTPTARR